MGAFGVILRSLHCMGLYIQLSASLRQAGSDDVENHISNNAVFTEVPHDITAQSGQDVEMACSFRGAGSPSYSLEIQWWYIRNHREWTEKQTWSTNQVVPQNEMSKDATKISVVKVAGSNISHKLRLSSVKPSDEGTYECHVIDFSDSKLRHHRVRAYLQVERAEGNVPPPAQQGATSQEERLQSDHHKHHKPGRELRKRSADDSTTDCTESCAL
ncbi:V-set and transmembrane domain-containing protein 2-like protein [Sinocyclocheilus anshuiensis]|uniref:V-set and transmembrane domain-containing protein 2-like protein n=1 Tax=Sinocyclocheilus anshuiensis TaxID=1608454 RepID=A0A671LH93_9TELE|nr:PREDICTED: V-set and transmembrane domain-containing protein 2-like protein [Sinocyclocheilus anshuiensis]